MAIATLNLSLSEAAYLMAAIKTSVRRYERETENNERRGLFAERNRCTHDKLAAALRAAFPEHAEDYFGDAL